MKLEYKPLTTPTLSWNKKTLTSQFGELIVQPLEPGFGMTLGNALRRVLLGSVEGSAVSSIVIKGINNEFATLSGVVEDATQLVLNFKQIVIRNKTGKPGTMKLNIKGPATVTVGDIKADDHLELVNKDHVLAHLANDGVLEVEFLVESGRGYQPAKWPMTTSLQEDGRIYLDAMFSPVVKITFDVEKTRVGGDIDYDKLLFRVYTDGSENPLDVMHYAVSVLRTQLQHFLTSAEIPFNELVSSQAEVQQSEQVTSVASEMPTRGLTADILLKSIDDLELSVRAHNCLVNAGIKRVIDLVNLTKDAALKLKNFGRKSLDEIEENLSAYGLTLGMNIKEEDVRKGMQPSEQ